jgi:integrase
MPAQRTGSMTALTPVGPSRDRVYRWKLQAPTGGRTPSGARERLTETFVGNKTEASARLAELLKVANATEAKLHTDWSVDSYISHHLEELAKAGKEHGTIERYHSLRRAHIGPVFGNKALSDITTQMVDNLLANMLGAGLSPSSRKQCRILLGATFDRARKAKLISTNPVDDAVKVTVPQRKQKTIATNDELTQALAFAATLGTMEHLVIRLCAMTGARRGEVCALQWSRVDLDNGTVDIVNALAKVGGGAVALKSTKTADERLGLHVDPLTAELLREVHAQRIDGGQWVLSWTGGLDPMHPDHLTGLWKRVRAAIPSMARGVRLHDLRHWSVTSMLDDGVALHEVARRHGHVNGNVTLAVYAHARGADDAANVARLAERLK